MAHNPLQQYFRQPKIYVALPSKGIYNSNGMIKGDVNHLPIYGMTGMDEIIMKTPDALLSGDSTTRVINSCCPAVTDPWEVCNLDMDTILTAIRVATYGNEVTVTKICEKCSADNEYMLDLNVYLEHYQHCEYQNQVIHGDLVITIRPLTYKQTTAFSLENFKIQQRLNQIDSITDETEKRQLMSEVFQNLAELRNTVFATGIESVTAGSTVVTDPEHIQEWITNADRGIVDSIRKVVEQNQQTWANPKQPAVCHSCGHEGTITMDLDQSSFFVSA